MISMLAPSAFQSWKWRFCWCKMCFVQEIWNALGSGLQVFNKAALNNSNKWRNLQMVSCTQRGSVQAAGGSLTLWHGMEVGFCWSVMGRGAALRAQDAAAWRGWFSSANWLTAACSRARQIYLLGLGMVFASWLLMETLLLFLISYILSSSFLCSGYRSRRALSCRSKSYPVDTTSTVRSL